MNRFFRKFLGGGDPAAITDIKLPGEKFYKLHAILVNRVVQFLSFQNLTKKNYGNLCSMQVNSKFAISRRASSARFS